MVGRYGELRKLGSALGMAFELRVVTCFMGERLAREMGSLAGQL